MTYTIKQSNLKGTNKKQGLIMVKKILAVVVFVVVAFSGCSQTKAEVKAPKAEANVTKAVVEKVAPKVGGGVTHVPFSEIAK